jgi:hypothetical protein
MLGVWHATSNFTPLGSSEFIPLALTLTQFTISQLLPSEAATIQLTRYSLSVVTHSLITHNWLNPHYSLNSVHCSLFTLSTDSRENALLLSNRYQVLLSGAFTYALPSTRHCMGSPVA